MYPRSQRDHPNRYHQSSYPFPLGFWPPLHVVIRRFCRPDAVLQTPRHHRSSLAFIIALMPRPINEGHTVVTTDGMRRIAEALIGIALFGVFNPDPEDTVSRLVRIHDCPPVDDVVVLSHRSLKTVQRGGYFLAECLGGDEDANFVDVPVPVFHALLPIVLCAVARSGFAGHAVIAREFTREQCWFIFCRSNGLAFLLIGS